jgi:ketosteroid isomerase-like protein
MTDGPSLEQRLQRLEDRFAISDLAASYCSAIDVRDLARFLSLFTDDIVLRHGDGVMRLDGKAAVESYYQERFAGYGYTFHYPHACTVTFHGDDEATGIVTGHAEMGVGGELVLAAIKYTDRYRRTTEGWRFAERELSFGYYMKLAELPYGFADSLRKHYKGERLQAELPESLATYRAWHPT